MAIASTVPLWKLQLQPASFNNVEFHVEVGTRAGGRRIAMHEFPKKDIPYAEDMGRRARQFTVVGYVIGPNFGTQRDALIVELDREINGTLVLPTSFDQKTVVCDRYSVTERREQGGYATLDMVFLEAGQDPSTQVADDTQAAVNNAVSSVTGSPTFLDTTNTFINSNDVTSLA